MQTTEEAAEAVMMAIYLLHPIPYWLEHQVQICSLPTLAWGSEIGFLTKY